MTAQITSKRHDPVIMSDGLYSDDRIFFDADAYTVARNGWQPMIWEQMLTLWPRIAEGKRRDG